MDPYLHPPNTPKSELLTLGRISVVLLEHAARTLASNAWLQCWPPPLNPKTVLQYSQGQTRLVLRAREGIRTPDLLITSELLYRLSYPGQTTVFE